MSDKFDLIIEVRRFLGNERICNKIKTATCLGLIAILSSRWDDDDPRIKDKFNKLYESALAYQREYDDLKVMPKGE